MKPKVPLSPMLMVMVIGMAMAIEFRDDAASKVKPFYNKTTGQLSHIVLQPFKMVTDAKNIDVTKLKENGLQIRNGDEENYITLNSRPTVVLGSYYQYAISCAGPRQQIRGRR